MIRNPRLDICVVAMLVGSLLVTPRAAGFSLREFSRTADTRVPSPTDLAWQSRRPVESPAHAKSVRDVVLQAEARRIEMIERVSPSIVCVFDSNLRGGGSGVLIDPEGYGLTNYHVVAGLLDTRRGWGGLGDRVLYKLEVLGIDVTGDVAMFRLIPPKKAFRFPYAELGDSDRVQIGDTAIAMGNPFILSEDYTPTVTLGLVTGVHRYQWGVRGNLVYTDCIQVDAPINPGNSGGPLFNAAGQIVGINGRISVNTRGRFNVGFGYAISVNQIRRFIPALRAGLLARHGTWQATVESVPDEGVVFARVEQPGAAYDTGIRTGDKILSMDGVPITSANQVVSLLGTYPADWPVVLTIEKDGRERDVIVRLEPIEPKLRRPFTADRAINLREVKRVLRAFRRRCGTALSSSTLRTNHRFRTGTTHTQWIWTVVRRHDPFGDGTVKPAERFEVSWAGDGPIRMQQRYEDGSAGRLIEYDDRTATQRVGENGESYELAADVKMVLASLYTMHRWLLEPVDDLDLTDVTHAGADVRVDQRAGSAQSLGKNQMGPSQDASQDWIPRNSFGTRRFVSMLCNKFPNSQRTLLEVIEWPVAGQATAGFAFDSESFAVVRVRVRDRPSGAVATIELSDHRDIGGLVWPCTIEVWGDGYGYRDTLSDWELSP